VSGNSPALGKNDPSLAIPMTTSSLEYPLWNSSPVFLSGDKGGIYKCFVVQSQSAV